MYNIPWFFGAAALGFILMAAFGIQAAVALFSSIPLIRRCQQECNEFNARRAYRRIAQVASLTIFFCILVTALVIHFGSTAVICGYGVGFLLAFVLSVKRMTPNNDQNRKNFETSYADCYPPSAINPDDLSGKS